MSDPADKSDDLIAELAKLMAAGPGAQTINTSSFGKPPATPQPAPPAAGTGAPAVRIPGMAPAAPRPASAAPETRPASPQPELRAVPPQPESRPATPPAASPQAAAPQSAPPQQSAAPRPAAPPVEPPRAVSTGTIRIPGMDQPAPVSTSAPVSKLDFGKPPTAATMRQEPLSTLSERLAPQNPTPVRVEPTAPSAGPAPVRIPSSLTPVSENKSFAESPALPVGRPVQAQPSAPAPAPAPAPVAPTPTPSAAPPVASPPAPAASAPPAGDFNFDFGFAQNPPATPTPLVMQPIAASADPIAALIEADMDAAPAAEAASEPEAEPEEARSEPPAPAAAQPQVASPVRPVTAAPQPPRPQIAQVSTNAPRPAASTPIPLKPVNAPPRPPESDRFAVSPGAGLNVKPSGGQPLATPRARATEPTPSRDESDPMSEIESLIGEAVRVELSPGPVRVQASSSVAPKVALEPEADLEREIERTAPQTPAPVVPPLTTQFAPRRANLKEDGSSRSAEEAILAAAAASGAEVGRIEPAVGDESPYRRLKVKPQRSSFLSGGVKQYVGMAVAGTLLLAAGLGLYWVLNMGRVSSTGADAPQLTAAATPVKEVPADVAKPVTDTAKSPVLAKMDGASAATSTEQLVSTDQATGDVTRDVTPAAGDDGENGLANRKVRTVTVRPDGTIVSGDDAVAGGEELPVDRPNVPSVPSTEAPNLLADNGGQASTAPLALQAPSAAATTDTAPTQVAETTAPVIDPTIVAPVPMQFPVRNAASRPAALSAPTNSSVNAVVGAQTPNGQIDLLAGNNTTQVAAAKPQTTTPAASSGGGAAAYVQLSSQPSQAEAQASMRTMTAKYGSLFGGSKLTVQQVDLGQKGVRWRVRLPAGSLTDATNICAQIKAQGGDCFATNG